MKDRKDSPGGLEDYLIHDTREAIMTKLESFADAFERLATTRGQRELAADFQEFVGFINGMMSGRDRTPDGGSYLQVVDERARSTSEPEGRRDKGKDREG